MPMTDSIQVCLDSIMVYDGILSADSYIYMFVHAMCMLNHCLE